MVQIRCIADDPIPAAVVSAHVRVTAAVGSDSFYKDVSTALEQAIPVDRFYLFEGRGRADALESLFTETEEDKPAVTDEAYARFLPVDPIQAGIDAATGEDMVIQVTVRPTDIVVPAYRQMLERARVIERVSFVGRHGRGWRCTTVVRLDESGPFNDQEQAWLGGFVRLLGPLIDRHRELVGEVVEDRTERLCELEQRFHKRFPELTPRERQICARAAIGISIEGAALDLGIGSASVLTYRKRAYNRLGVSSAYELARLVMR